MNNLKNIKLEKEIFTIIRWDIILFVIFLIVLTFILHKLVVNSGRKKLVMAHRGEHKNAVENTIESLISASILHPDYVELDIVESKDKEIFVIHDNDLKRLAQINNSIQKMTTSEVKNITLKQNGFEAKVPTLKEFIETALKLNINLNIEIKIYGNESKNYIDNIINLLNEYNVSKKYLIQSLNLDAILKFKEKAPEFKCGYIAMFPRFHKSLNKLDFLSVPKYDLAIDLLETHKKYNMPIYVWTIDDEDKALKLLKKGADGIITNNCETIQKHINNMQ